MAEMYPKSSAPKIRGGSLESSPVGVGCHQPVFHAKTHPNAPSKDTIKTAVAFFSDTLSVLCSSSIVGRSGDCIVELRRRVDAEDRLCEPGRPMLLVLPTVTVLFNRGWEGSSEALPLTPSGS